MSETIDVIRKAMEDLGDAVTGLQVRHRGRVLLLRPARGDDPRGKWAAMAMLEFEDGETDITIGYGETLAEALDDAVNQADEIENGPPSQFDGDNQAGPLGGGL